jgi:hypothetical protein
MTAIPAISAIRPPPCSFVSFVVKDFGFVKQKKSRKQFAWHSYHKS